MDLQQIAMYGAWALVLLFGAGGILFLAVTFFSREKVEKAKPVEVEQSFFSSSGVKTNPQGNAGTTTGFAFPSSRPAPVNQAPGELPPTMRARPLSPQEILSSISDDETSLEALQQQRPAPMKTPTIVPPRDDKA